jgi:hypothetical protein
MQLELQEEMVAEPMIKYQELEFIRKFNGKELA